MYFILNFSIKSRNYVNSLTFYVNYGIIKLYKAISWVCSNQNIIKMKIWRKKDDTGR